MLVARRAAWWAVQWELYWVDLHVVISRGCVTTKIKLTADIDQEGGSNVQSQAVIKGRARG